MSISETMKNENGVELRVIRWTQTGKVISYELYMDGEFLSRYHNEREARAMWKDFAGC